MRRLLKTFGLKFGKRVGGFTGWAEEIMVGELAVTPELVPIFEALGRRSATSLPTSLHSIAVSGRHQAAPLGAEGQCILTHHFRAGQ